MNPAQKHKIYQKKKFKKIKLIIKTKKFYDFNNIMI